MTHPLDDYLTEAAQELAEQREELIKQSVLEYVKIDFSQGVRVRIERPRWIPEPVFRALLRSVIVEQTPISYARRG